MKAVEKSQGHRQPPGADTIPHRAGPGLSGLRRGGGSPLRPRDPSLASPAPAADRHTREGLEHRLQAWPVPGSGGARPTAPTPGLPPGSLRILGRKSRCKPTGASHHRGKDTPPPSERPRHRPVPPHDPRADRGTGAGCAPSAAHPRALPGALPATTRKRLSVYSAANPDETWLRMRAAVPPKGAPSRPR